MMAQPPPKKRCTGPAAEAFRLSSSRENPKPYPNPQSSPRSRASSLYALSERSATSLRDSLDDIETSIAQPTLPALLSRTASRLLELKKYQRALCLCVERDLNDRVRGKRREMESEGLALQNLLYERDYLRGQIRSCRDYECKDLAKMAGEELGLMGGDEEEDGDVGEEVKFGENEGGGQKGNSGGGGDGGSGDKEDDKV